MTGKPVLLPLPHMCQNQFYFNGISDLPYGEEHVGFGDLIGRILEEISNQDDQVSALADFDEIDNVVPSEHGDSFDVSIPINQVAIS